MLSVDFLFPWANPKTVPVCSSLPPPILGTTIEVANFSSFGCIPLTQISLRVTALRYHLKFWLLSIFITFRTSPPPEKNASLPSVPRVAYLVNAPHIKKRFLASPSNLWICFLLFYAACRCSLASGASLYPLLLIGMAESSKVYLCEMGALPLLLLDSDWVVLSEERL